ncbi:unnamed protein product [Rhizoctonia solani]|uniref:Uncharacterized protein n=1 Tax=Rhizoctonia solani TaxID=456999 RepID=A0A8H3HFK1_9AGAM|nr:unnamed protein product [Rhizoctonia solani]CAE7146457.1 unnamed protein product [Rhizoctonia solani]
MPFYNPSAYSGEASPPPSPLLDPIPRRSPPSLKKYDSNYRKPVAPLDPSKEYIKDYETCPAAARACCRFVEERSAQIDPYELKLYRRQIPGSDGKGLVIGVGVETPSGEIRPIAIIENDLTNDTGRGIYFTGTIPSSMESFVACLRKSAELHPVYRHVIYLDYLRLLQNRSASLIWDWWKSGLDMDGLDEGIERGR